jgi:hypothetical protein
MQHTLFRVIHELFGFKGRRHGGFPDIAPNRLQQPHYLLVEPSLADEVCCTGGPPHKGNNRAVWLERIDAILSVAGMRSPTHVIGNLQSIEIMG